MKYNKSLLGRSALLIALMGSTFPAYAEYTYAHIGSQRMQSVVNHAPTPAIPIAAKKKKKPKIEVRREESPVAQRETVYETLFDTNRSTETSVANDALDRDLELLKGTATPEANLLNRIDSTRTVFGEAQLAHTILNPINDIETLQQRQTAIMELVDNPSLYAALEAELEAIKAVQAEILGYWQAVSPEETKALSAAYFNKPIFRRLNTNTTGLEAGNHLSSFLSAIKGGTMVWTIAGPQIGLDLYQNRTFKPKEWSNLCLDIVKTILSPLDPRQMREVIQLYRIIETMPGLKTDAQRKATKILMPIMYGVSVGIAGYFGWQLYSAGSDINYRYDLTRTLQQRVMSFGQLVQSADTMRETIQLSALSNVVQHMAGAFRTDDGEYTSLCNRLRTKTFKGSASKFSLNGRVLATHKQIEANKQSFVDMMLFVGELDAYLSAAHLMRHNSANGYCLASYVSDSAQPVVEINELWNPFIDADKAVANSVSFGTTEHNRNMVLTGPNAGGKSTALKAITLSVLLAQSYGIAPARSMSLTPFAKICSYLNITDDLALGNSLFKAEVLRAKKLKETIAGLPAHKFVFSVVDELFTGTAADKGEAAAHRFMADLTDIRNSMCIFATHYPSITDLAQEHSCINMRVGTPDKVEGKLVYPFTLEEGIAQVNVANDILEEEGIF